MVTELWEFCSQDIVLLQYLPGSDSLGTEELDMELCSAPEDKNVFLCDFI